MDDFCIAEILKGNRLAASAADLAFAIKLFLGHDGLSLKKFKAGSCWSELQKVIGGWFCVDTFTVIMPEEKVKEILAIFE